MTFRLLMRVGLAAAGSAAMVLGASQAGAASTGFGGAVRGSLPSGTGVIDAVTCISGSRDCLAVGGFPNGAVILFSPDGGLSWTNRPVPAGWAGALAVTCSGSSFCMVSVGRAAAGAILTTSDEGRHWTQLPSPTASGATSIACPTALICLVSDTDSSGAVALYRTTDAGRTWSAAQVPPGAGASTFVTCLDATRCWAAGGAILGSTDGGATWSQEYPLGAPAPGIGPPSVWGVSFINDRQGWAAGGQQCGGPSVRECPGDVLATADGGKSWRIQQDLPNGPFLSGISCTSSRCVLTGSIPGGYEALAFSGSGPVAPIAGTTVTRGSITAPSCGGWGCLIGGSEDGSGLVLTARTVAAVSPAPRGTWIGGLIPTYQEVSWKAEDVLRSALLAAGLLLLIAFPSQIFNSTLMSHYEEVAGWFAAPRRLAARFAFWRRRREDGVGAGGVSTWQLSAVFVLGGLFGTLLDPQAGLDATTAESFLGILLATAFTTAIYTWVRAFGLRRATGLRGHLGVYWLGVAVAAVCLLVSRVTSAEPGYLYGVLLGYSIDPTVKLKRHHEGRLAGAGAGAVLAVSLAIWLLWTPVSAAAASNPGFVLETLSTAMAAIFLGGMTSLMFGMLPLRWLDGEKLFAWRRLVWTATIGLALFLFVHVVLRAGSTPGAKHSLVVTAALFAGFGLLSIGFWAYFYLREGPTPAQGSVVPETAPDAAIGEHAPRSPRA